LTHLQGAKVRSLLSLPKCHLHLHLTGSLRQSTYLELSRKHGVSENTASHASFDTFLDFDEVYRGIRQCVKTPEDLARIIEELVEDAAAQGVWWVEVSSLMTGMSAQVGMKTPEAWDLAFEVSARKAKELGIGVGWIMTASRPRPLQESEDLAKQCIEYFEAGKPVVGFGLVGEEVGEVDKFVAIFTDVKAAGIPVIAPHAGEQLGSETVRELVNALEPTRLGHGVRAIEDATVIEMLRQKNICLDIAPSSNLALRVFTSWAKYPLKEIIRAGVPCTINADDPIVFQTDIVKEYEKCREYMGLTDNELANCARDSFKFSGAPKDVKDKGLQKIDSWLEDS